MPAHFPRNAHAEMQERYRGSISWNGDAEEAFRRLDGGAHRLPARRRQMERHDPKGTYVRRWVPELSEVPDAYLAEPGTMPAAVQRAVGCEVRADYPAPIVDHRRARERALERYRA